jgi:thiol:disulfide interchange protein
MARKKPASKAKRTTKKPGSSNKAKRTTAKKTTAKKTAASKKATTAKKKPAAKKGAGKKNTPTKKAAGKQASTLKEPIYVRPVGQARPKPSREHERRDSILGLFSLLAGAISVLFLFIYPVSSVILGLLAIAFSKSVRVRENNIPCALGFVLGLLGMLVGLVVMVLMLLSMFFVVG